MDLLSLSIELPRYKTKFVQIFKIYFHIIPFHTGLLYLRLVVEIATCRFSKSNASNADSSAFLILMEKSSSSMSII